MILSKAQQGLITTLVSHIYDVPGREAAAQRVCDALRRNGPPAVAAALWHQGAAYRSLEHRPQIDMAALDKFCEEVESLIGRVRAGDSCLLPDLEFALVIATEPLKLPFMYLGPIGSPSSEPLQAAIDDFYTVWAMWRSDPGRRSALDVALCRHPRPVS